MEFSRKCYKISNTSIQRKVLSLRAVSFSQSWPLILSDVQGGTFGDTCPRTGPAEVASLEIGEVNKNNSLLPFAEVYGKFSLGFFKFFVFISCPK